MKYLLGNKITMTEIFTDKGEAFPATVIEAGPVVVTQVKTAEKDGYSAIQFGFGATREKLVSKPRRGHFKELGLFRHVREARVADAKDPLPERGAQFDVTAFKEGDLVTVVAIGKGKGHQGPVKRHHFKGGSRTHGQKHSEREAGAIGGGARAGGRVAKGIRMAGRMGGDRVTLKNLKVLGVDKESNRIYLHGSVPGRRGTLVEIKG